MMPKFFHVSYPVNRKSRDGKKAKRWIRIGSATQMENGIACTLDAIPINWDGEFFLFPVEEPKENDR